MTSALVIVGNHGKNVACEDIMAVLKIKEYEFIVDDAFYPTILEVGKWHLMKTKTGHIYAAHTTKYDENGKQGRIFLHRFIINAPDNAEVDHKNGDTLDNRSENLRITTHKSNMTNMKANRRNKSGFRGVCWHKGAGKWIVNILVNGKRIHLGYYGNYDEACDVMREACKKYRENEIFLTDEKYFTIPS